MAGWKTLHSTNTINNEKLVGLKFGESANKSVWRKKVGEFIQNCNYVCMDIRLICAIGE